MTFELFSLLNILLDTNGSDFFTFVGIGTILAGLAAAIGLIITLKQANDAKYLDFLKETDTEIAEHLQKENELKDVEQCTTYAYVYLDIIERIAFLYKHNKIPFEFVKYYDTYFNYAITMMAWYETVYDDQVHTPKDEWPELIEWFNYHTMDPYPATHLPSKMLKELKVPENIFDKLKKYLGNMKIKDKKKDKEVNFVAWLDEKGGFRPNS